MTNETGGALRTMVEVKESIHRRRQALARVPFLQGLERASSLEHVRQFAPHLYFYVFSFQDMLRISADRIADPELRRIAEQHYAEDEGHHLWFASDAIELGFERPLTWVLGREHAPMRDLCYELLALLLEVRDDRVRLVFPLILEAAGAEFFFRVVDLLGRAGYQGKLTYFARSHQNVEADHDVFAGPTLARIDAITFDAETYRDAIALVERAFDLLEAVAAHIEAQRAQAGGA